MAWATLVSRFIAFLHCCAFADSLQSAALLFVPSTSPDRSPFLPPAVSSSTLAATFSPLPSTSTPCLKTVFRFRIPRGSISAFHGAYTLFLSFPTRFRPSKRLAISVSSLKGEFYFL